MLNNPQANLFQIWWYLPLYIIGIIFMFNNVMNICWIPTITRLESNPKINYPWYLEAKISVLFGLETWILSLKLVAEWNDAVEERLSRPSALESSFFNSSLPFLLCNGYDFLLMSLLFMTLFLSLFASFYLVLSESEIVKPFTFSVT